MAGLTQLSVLVENFRAKPTQERLTFDFPTCVVPAFCIFLNLNWTVVKPSATQHLRIGASSLEVIPDLADAELIGLQNKERQLNVDLRMRILVAAKATKVDLSARPQELSMFLTGLVVKDARLALRLNEYAKDS